MSGSLRRRAAAVILTVVAFAACRIPSAAAQSVLVDTVIALPYPNDGATSTSQDRGFVSAASAALATFAGVPTNRAAVFWYNGGAVLTANFLPTSATAAATLTTALTADAPSSSSLGSALANAYSAAYGATYSDFVFGQCDYSTSFPSTQPARGPADTSDCGTVLTLTVVSARTFTSSSAATLCGAISVSLNCSKMTFAGTSPVAGQPATAVSLPTDSHSGIMVLAALVAALRSDINVRALSISQLSVNDVVVYTTAVPPPASHVVTCQDRLKWLIFLLLIVPLFAVAARFTFRKGVYRGQEVARRDDRSAHDKITRIQTGVMGKADGSSRALPPSVFRSSSTQPSVEGNRSQSQATAQGYAPSAYGGSNRAPPSGNGLQRAGI